VRIDRGQRRALAARGEQTLRLAYGVAGPRTHDVAGPSSADERAEGGDARLDRLPLGGRGDQRLGGLVDRLGRGVRVLRLLGQQLVEVAGCEVPDRPVGVTDRLLDSGAALRPWLARRDARLRECALGLRAGLLADLLAGGCRPLEVGQFLAQPGHVLVGRPLLALGLAQAHVQLLPRRDQGRQLLPCLASWSLESRYANSHVWDRIGGGSQASWEQARDEHAAQRGWWSPIRPPPRLPSPRGDVLPLATDPS
jgi:hypothetical protein